MIKFKMIVAVIGAMLLSTPAFANQYERYWNGSCYAYRIVAKPVVQQVKNQTTVVNNLVGIPVPVQYSQPIAAQGTTVYGYQSISDYYNQVDMGLLYNQAARLTDQAQQLAGQAATDFHTMIHAEGQQRAEVARILAQGQAAREALLATQPLVQQQAVTQRAFSFKVSQDVDGKIKIEQMDGSSQMNEVPAVPSQSEKLNFDLLSPKLQSSEAKAAAVSSLLTTKCVNCHGNTKASGGLNLMLPISDEQQNKILSRVMSEDPDKMMPRNRDGGPGDHLSRSELKLLWDVMGSGE